jgi:hypothetical protein
MKIGDVLVLCRDSWRERLRSTSTPPGFKVLNYVLGLLWGENELNSTQKTLQCKILNNNFAYKIEVPVQ